MKFFSTVTFTYELMSNRVYVAMETSCRLDMKQQFTAKLHKSVPLDCDDHVSKSFGPGFSYVFIYWPGYD